MLALGSQKMLCFEVQNAHVRFVHGILGEGHYRRQTPLETGQNSRTKCTKNAHRIGLPAALSGWETSFFIQKKNTFPCWVCYTDADILSTASTSFILFTRNPLQTLLSEQTSMGRDEADIKYVWLKGFTAPQCHVQRGAFPAFVVQLNRLFFFF